MENVNSTPLWETLALSTLHDRFLYVMWIRIHQRADIRPTLCNLIQEHYQICIGVLQEGQTELRREATRACSDDITRGGNALMRFLPSRQTDKIARHRILR
jgi:hypothetical protein